jgi:hypothetical protein
VSLLLAGIHPAGARWVRFSPSLQWPISVAAWPSLPLRCPMLNVNPKVLPRLNEIEDDLTLTFLCQKRGQAKRLTRIAPIALGMPAIPAAKGER